MSKSLAREVGLLRDLVAHLEWRPLSFDRLTQQYLQDEGLGHVRERPGGVICIRAPAHHTFLELLEGLLAIFPEMQRGVFYPDVQSQLFNFIDKYIGREPSSVDIKDAEGLIAHFDGWFASKCRPRRVFVPCVISQIEAPRFNIGPVTFEFIDRVTTSDFYPRGGLHEALDQRGVNDLLIWMREQDADWLARVPVDGCEQGRAEQIAELSVDLAIVAFQLAALRFRHAEYGTARRSPRGVNKVYIVRGRGIV